MLQEMRVNKLRSSTLGLALVAAAMLSSPASLAQPTPLESSTSVYFRDADGNSMIWRDPELLLRSHAFDSNPPPPSGISTNSDFARSSHFAAVSAPYQTLRGSNQLSLRSSMASGAASTDTSTSIGFSKTVLVDPGSSGLAFGAPLTLTLSLQLHGINETGYMPPPSGGTAFSADWSRILTSIDSSFAYRMVDLDDMVCDEGCRPRQLARFDYGSRLLYDAVRTADGAAYDIDERSGWDMFGTVSGYQASPYVNDYSSGVSAIPGSVRREINTGVLRITLDTFIGHTLKIDAWLDLFNQSYSLGLAGSALGDFRNTFDADLRSDVAGVELIGELGGIAAVGAVPEPGSWVLLLAGLAGLLGWRRRAGRSIPN
jgi:hypothetical protein